MATTTVYSAPLGLSEGVETDLDAHDFDGGGVMPMMFPDDYLMGPQSYGDVTGDGRINTFDISVAAGLHEIRDFVPLDFDDSGTFTSYDRDILWDGVRLPLSSLTCPANDPPPDGRLCFKELTASVWKSAVIDAKSIVDYDWFLFTPSTSGVYMFEASAGFALHGELYDKDGVAWVREENWTKSHDKLTGALASGLLDGNAVAAQLTAGNEYFLRVRAENSGRTGSYSVRVVEGALPPKLKFTLEGGGKYIFSNSPETITEDFLVNGTGAKNWIMRNQNLVPGNYTLALYHHTGLGKEITVDAEFYSQTGANITITNIGVQKPEGAGWSSIAGYSNYQWINVWDNAAGDYIARRRVNLSKRAAARTGSPNSSAQPSKPLFDVMIMEAFSYNSLISEKKWFASPRLTGK
jgi:hypothetical protein